MGTQRYLVEDIERKGVQRGEVPMPMVCAIERMRSVGDDVNDILHAWLRDALTRDEMLVRVHKRLADVGADLGIVAYWTGRLDLS